MALSDPQTVTVNAVAQVMPRVNSGNLNALYQKADQTFGLEVSHQEAKVSGKTRFRHRYRLTERAVVTSQLDSSNSFDTCSITIIIDRPEFGFTATRVKQLVAGVEAHIDDALVDKIYGRES